MDLFILKVFCDLVGHGVCGVIHIGGFVKRERLGVFTV
jgi:hypothetical protein